MKKILLSLMLTLFFSASAMAQWPTQQVKIIIPYGAGGTTDILVRTMAPELSKLLGQDVVVINKPGGEAMIGAREVEKTRDNHTFLATADGFVTNSITIPEGTHHMKNFRSVTFLAHSPILLTSKEGGEIKNIKQVLNKKGVTYGNSGSKYAIGKLVLKIAQPTWTPVTYKGGPLSFGDLISGNIDLVAASTLQSNSYIKNKQVRPLLIFNDKRVAHLPNVPTAKEVGINLEGKVWLGFVTAKSTSDEAVNKMSDASIKVLNNKTLMKPLIAKGLTVEPKGSKEFDAYIQSDLELKKKMLAQVGDK